MVNKEERQILRSLASKLASIASLPENDRKRILWTKHNSLKNVRPMMIIYPEGAWSELIPATMLVCTDIKAREIEWKLKAMIYRYEHFHDDFVVEKKWYVNKVIIEPEWSIPIKYNGNDTYTNYLSRYWSNDVVLGVVPRIWDENFRLETVSWVYHPVIKKPSDLKKFRYPYIFYDLKKTKRELELTQDLLGDILEVELIGKTRIPINPAMAYCGLRGLHQAMLDFYDNPNMIRDFMSIYTEGYEKLVDQYIANNLFSLNNNGSYNGSGGVGYIEELPSETYNEKKVLLKDLWGFAQAQDFSEKSPDMHAEYIFPYERKLLESFGLGAYGCCESLDAKLDVVTSCKNLRRISISP